MTTYYSDPIFTGEITDKDASLAADNIRHGKFCDCPTCTGKVKPTTQKHKPVLRVNYAGQGTVNYGE